MSWKDFTMDLASIPKTETEKKENSEEEIVVSPENEEAELRKSLRL